MKYKWKIKFKFQKKNSWDYSKWYSDILGVENFIEFLIKNVIFYHGENLCLEIIEKEVKA